MQTTADKTQTSEDEYSHSAISERLISLVDNKKSASVEDSVYRLVKREFESIKFARDSFVAWREIAETCGFPGKESQMRNAFRLEQLRREKKEKVKAVVPDKKGKGVLPDVKPGIRPDPAVRVGLPRPIGRGRLDLGEDTPPGEI